MPIVRAKPDDAAVLTDIAFAAKRHWGYPKSWVESWGIGELEIESDPNAEGFYRRMGARRVGASSKELDGQRRELPILVYEISPEASQ
jgi:hypothetical protein